MAPFLFSPLVPPLPLGYWIKRKKRKKEKKEEAKRGKHTHTDAKVTNER